MIAKKNPYVAGEVAGGADNAPTDEARVAQFEKELDAEIEH